MSNKVIDFSEINIDTNTCKIGFIGAGNMSMAIIKGLLKFGNVDASRLYVSAPSNQNLPKFEQLGCTTTNDNYSLVYNYKCSIIFLCVKPHHITPETHIFKLVTVKHPLVIMSAVAGMTLEALYDNCFTNGVKYENCCIYRIMPNLACQVGKGVCGISRILPSEETLDTCIKDFLERIFSCHFLDEHKLDQLTALSGSGIAFAFTFIQAMADGGVKIGLPRELAVSVVTDTISGACAMVNATKKHPIELRDAVCSPAGTTIYGVHALQKAKFSSAVIDSVTSSYSRCIELKK